MVQNGLDITGLDVVPTMLEQARRKADVRSFRLEKQFYLIVGYGCVFMHMLSNADQRAFLWLQS